MTRAYIGLGSNLGNKTANLHTALELLQGRGVQIEAVSDFISTKPFGVLDQPDFLNAVVAVKWQGSAKELLYILLDIEKNMGRLRKRHWGERNIDLDLLLFGQEIKHTPELELPHPGIAERLFVLQPLAQLAPAVEHPVLHKTIKQLWLELRNGGSTSMKCYEEMKGLIVYRELLEDATVQKLFQEDLEESQLVAAFLAKAEEFGLSGNIPVAYIYHLIGHQKNAFSTVAEKNNGWVGSGIMKAVTEDIIILRQFIADLGAAFAGHKFLDNYEPTVPNSSKGQEILRECFQNYGEDSTGKEAAKRLCAYYAHYGYGMMIDNVAFNWEGDEQILTGIRNYSTTTFDDIVGYDTQKDELKRNTEAFLHNKPANNVLLFGDRGCGKSSSLKAVGNAYYAEGLRMVQVSREYFTQLPKIMKELSQWGKKFIIVLDDLSFEEFEIEYKVLKSILDGGLEVRPENILFYATSNRRNIIKEVWQDQNQNELHNRDSVNEKVSMADRFGIKLYYDSMDQDEYFNLLETVAKKENLNISTEELHAAAVKWEMNHTGRNGRMARQLIDYLQGN